MDFYWYNTNILVHLRTLFFREEYFFGVDDLKKMNPNEIGDSLSLLLVPT